MPDLINVEVKCHSTTLGIVPFSWVQPALLEWAARFLRLVAPGEQVRTKSLL